MNEYNNDKKYDSFKIPDRWQEQEGRGSWSLPQSETDTSKTQEDGLFYVIDYDSSNMEGVGKFVLKSQKIDPPVRDEIRERFHSMRDIARANRTPYFDNNRFFDKRVQQENAIIFYKQGIFMKDFTDSYSEQTQFSSYFPNYQMMSYEQLRTYFTWRTRVRQGNVTNTSLSYAFLYIYELLGNIGVDDPQDGFNKLMYFWKEFRIHNGSIDRYVLRWLKDYHIYYELPQSFREFVEVNNLTRHYPWLTDTVNNFDLLCTISKYNIRSSAFFTDEKIKLITDCFYFITDKLGQIFASYGIPYEELIFQPKKKLSAWQPFREALFYQWRKQTDRRIVLSENEVYFCSKNNWTTGKFIPSEDSRLLIGYIMKQMEAVLRVATQYKYKLVANINMLSDAVLVKLKNAGLSLEKVITDLVQEFYREATKTVVSVDPEMLSRIRQESLVTQEKLIVPEQKEASIPFPVPTIPTAVEKSLVMDMSSMQDTPSAPDMPIVPDIPSMQSMSTVQEYTSVSEDIKPTTTYDLWEGLKRAFNRTELEALSVLISREMEIKKFADSNGIMLEVLIDGINEKALDFIGDNLLDEEFIIYDDYKDQIKEMITI